MRVSELSAALPPYAKDLASNLNALVADGALSDQQKWGCFLAAAHAVGAPAVLRAIEDDARGVLSTEAVQAAKAASALMSMNNIYFHATHIMTNQGYAAMRAGLRMSLALNPGVDRCDFELWELAVSAINGCAACLDAHEAEVRKHGLEATHVQAALKIAAVVHAVSAVARAEGL